MNYDKEFDLMKSNERGREGSEACVKMEDGLSRERERTNEQVGAGYHLFLPEG